MTNREFLTAFTEGKNTEETKKDILAALVEKPMTAAEIGEACGISTNKASALAKQLADDKKVTRTEIKVPKKGKCFQYALATEVEGETEE